MKKIISWFLCITMLAGCLILGGCTQSAKSGSSAQCENAFIAGTGRCLSYHACESGKKDRFGK